MLDFATVMYMMYTGVTGGMFLFNPQLPLRQTFSDALAGEAYRVGLVYHEVVGMMNLVLLVGTCPGPKGYLMGSALFCSMMLKHILVDGLMPPPPVMALGALSLLTSVYGVAKESNHGKWTFSLMNLLNAIVFLMNPGQPVQDSFPDVADGSRAYFIGSRLCEVIGVYALAQFLTNCPPPLGRAMAMSCLCALVYKHDTVDNIGPPKPVLYMIMVTTAAQWLSFMSKKIGGSPSAVKAKDA